MIRPFIGLLALASVGLTQASEGKADDLPSSLQIEDKLSHVTERLSGMLLVKDDLQGKWVIITALPLPTTWKLVCGSSGLMVHLGPPDSDNDVMLTLIDRVLSEGDCITAVKAAEGPLRRLTAAPQDVARSEAGAP